MMPTPGLSPLRGMPVEGRASGVLLDTPSHLKSSPSSSIARRAARSARSRATRSQCLCRRSFGASRRVAAANQAARILSACSSLSSISILILVVLVAISTLLLLDLPHNLEVRWLNILTRVERADERLCAGAVESKYLVFVPIAHVDVTGRYPNLRGVRIQPLHRDGDRARLRHERPKMHGFRSQRTRRQDVLFCNCNSDFHPPTPPFVLTGALAARTSSTRVNRAAPRRNRQSTPPSRWRGGRRSRRTRTGRGACGYTPGGPCRRSTPSRSHRPCCTRAR